MAPQFMINNVDHSIVKWQSINNLKILIKHKNFYILIKYAFINTDHKVDHVFLIVL